MVGESVCPKYDIRYDQNMTAKLNVRLHWGQALDIWFWNKFT